MRPALAAAALAVLVGGTPVVAAEEVTVAVRSMSYDPSEMIVARGTRVIWENVTSPSRIHDVVSSIQDYFVSPRYGGGESWARTFGASGTFTYICSIHDVMLGSVQVPLRGTVLSDDTGVTMRIRTATKRLPSGSPFLYVVSRRDPGGTTFVPWRYTRRVSVDFHPPGPGVYEFVMRVKNVDSSRLTGPAGDSPVLAMEWAG